MKITVTCRGADSLPVDALEEFQGGLKKITKANLEKLKRRIIRDGINVPVFVWRIGDWCRVLDGHQRLKALASLRADGYELPLVPVAYIDAADEKDARQKLLGITSQYGEFEIGELGEWMAELDADIAETVRLADGEVRAKWGDDEIYTEDKSEIKSNVEKNECPKCGFKWQSLK